MHAIYRGRTTDSSLCRFVVNQPEVVTFVAIMASGRFVVVGSEYR